MKQVMIDIETMGNGSRAALLSISAVRFNMATGEIGDKFTVGVDLQSCIDRGLRVDGSTVEWWLSQKREAQSRILELKKLRIDLALRDLSSFLAKCRPTEIWANSPSFDLVILRNAYLSVHEKAPWEYYQERDCRTLASFRPNVRKTVDFVGTAHDGVDDCIHQITYCSIIYNQLNS